MSERRRGRRPTKLTATMEAMRQEILSGSITPIQLGSMLEKNLSQRYGVSRDTARKARNGVLSEFA
jgi:DNA-binding GntR family transcriptional regulator